ncbi:aconitate hydratase AcnA [Stenotrophomonas pavanii]|uniref:aconitate hydratase AcnA n=1 Tax=Stenotrophomonas pavanii TaxID=487698 RepID=UPI00113E8204|nr:aconitate hydratase AcnA [Stenotrophomonas pavanii]MBH1629062.1 aconitate hydratase AcnA [Stenotrophomonas maltophilia]TGR55817.1 aconitate hydratase AcnA [bacterium M00.F.Ca.ET.199.01.1.1]TGT08880.1 aconitate hydratase AcnA [bacterium M00.F.Ca.ET.177.01.1.1]TGT66816.1 aconitate hydratase AcnA [Mesorhizobium sp. M00.F.Ca.ET.170.01.1.1]TGU15727.1 aconitate hydratase AcnA [bacterium M00.F.Ca.ET.163.01.1.1]TGU98454.1 aconitate hydratase AcnA [Mesorhizobium sp. M00.F.Ca.ET.151.01.1.1]TGV60120
MSDSFSTRSQLNVGGKTYDYFSLPTLGQRFDISHLPYSMKILLENLLRHEDGGVTVGKDHIEAVARWNPAAEPDTEIAFMPARVVLQDFTGVPCVVDLAAMRDAVVKLGGKPEQINPQIPSELVIDHSVQVDVFGKPDALDLNGKIEFQRNQERYGFLRWGQKAFDNFKVVPPNTGIVHQVNLENLARVVMTADKDGKAVAYPDTVFGTDSHTTMINGIGVLGWGVGGIEAEAAMLGQPSSMLIPQVVGFKLTGKLPEGATATDLVLTVTQMLRKLGVVGKFVEFYGDGLQHLPLADRATIGNMAPEYGATCGIFPIDAESLNYLRLSGRSEEQINLVEAYAKAQGLWHEPGSPHAQYSTTLELDMGTVKPSLAGPKRPQDRVLLEDVQKNYREALVGMTSNRDKRSDDVSSFVNEGGGAAVGNEQLAKGFADIEIEGRKVRLKDGAVVIAAITSCTNTSNPAVMIGAGLLARNAAAKGLNRQPWVKTSLGPGSRVVTDYLEKAGVLKELEKIGFYVVGYGCTTCIGNSGPLPTEVSAGIAAGDLVVTSVLSGNRNFEGRVHPEVKMNYLASPPLVVAYAIAGTTDIDLTTQPLGTGSDGQPVFLRDIWPSNKEIGDVIAATIGPEMFKQNYADVFKGDTRWNTIASPDGNLYAWSDASTYIKNPPYFDGMTMQTGSIDDVHGARVMGLFGDSITTDHISPAGNIKKDSPAGRFLQERGVQPADFNSYGSRRGNDDVMVRGTFANIRIKNLMFGGEEGGNTLYYPAGGGQPEKLAIYDAAMKYKADKVPLVVLAGKEYGTGSSRDWAAKGTLLLGVKAVIAESFERIHRSNLVGMGVLPLQFRNGENAQSLGLDGSEVIDITGLQDGASKRATVTATKADGTKKTFEVSVMLLTPKEVEYFRHGGLLQYVLRQLASK